MIVVVVVVVGRWRKALAKEGAMIQAKVAEYVATSLLKLFVLAALMMMMLLLMIVVAQKMMMMMLILILIVIIMMMNKIVLVLLLFAIVHVVGAAVVAFACVARHLLDTLRLVVGVSGRGRSSCCSSHCRRHQIVLTSR